VLKIQLNYGIKNSVVVQRLNIIKFIQKYIKRSVPDSGNVGVEVIVKGRRVPCRCGAPLGLPPAGELPIYIRNPLDPRKSSWLKI
jgi:hypothetical protein